MMNERVATHHSRQAENSGLVAGGVLRRKCACTKKRTAVRPGGHNKSTTILQRKVLNLAGAAKPDLIVTPALQAALPLNQAKGPGDFCRLPVLRKSQNGILQQFGVSSPNDKYEQEAHRVSESVLRMTVPPHIGRDISPSDKRGNAVIRTTPASAPAVKRSIEKGSHTCSPRTGKPLPDHTRSYFEPRFDFDFSGVRIHTDSQAAGTAEALNAQAYTFGRDIVFGPGKFAPGTPTGDKLIAHELTHVIQQTASTSRIQRSPVKQRSPGFLLQGRWQSPSAASSEWTRQHVNPPGTFLTFFGSLPSARVEYARFLERGVQGKVETQQILALRYPHRQTGGTASLRMWKYTRYTFNHTGDDANLLELTINTNISGGAKAQDCHYARGGAATFGFIKVRTPSRRSPPATQLFNEMREGGESACSRVPAGEFEVIIPINGGSARLRIPLERHREGALAAFGRSLPVITREVAGMAGGWPVVDVYLGAYMETAADIESALWGIAWEHNWAHATAEYNLSWRERILPPSPAPEAREVAPVQPHSAAPYAMRFQVQWASRSGGPTFSEHATAHTDPGVRTEQAVSALNAVVAKVTPNRARSAAEPAKQRQITWVNRQPPTGIAQQGYSHSEYFSYRNYTDARVDVENLRGHNLRQ